ncbi:hypothetical protein [Spirosoma spitsbergense]|uniref:hypothetical protein n=1 Tax=Spirosoma spitsbergense TaxID=431554 RepID=UPI0005A90CC2|nr:hypothetical protein [Spirosoma spitsbergense]
MRTLLTKKAAACIVVTASLIAYPILSSVAVKMPTQSVAKTTQLVEPIKQQSENPTLARNTAKKTESSSTESPAKEQQVQDKKAIGRCWKRLMNMVREVRHAQTNKK